MNRRIVASFLALALLVVLPGRSAMQSPSVVSADLAARAAQGLVRVMVRLDGPVVAADQWATVESVSTQRARIASAQDAALATVSDFDGSLTRFETLPGFAITTDQEGLARLAALPNVVAIEPDRLVAPALIDSTAIIRASTLWSQGTDGSGWAVAVLDNGIQTSHSFFTGRVESDSCYSTTSAADGATSLCPNTSSSQESSGAAVNCVGIAGCDHGTHVAGIATGRGTSFAGVARGARLIPIQVYSRISNALLCGNAAGCVLSYSSDQIRGLERVLVLAGPGNANKVAAANLSLADPSTLSATACDSVNTLYKQAIDNLRSIGIATVISAGNSGSLTQIAFPSCISSAVSVGSADKSDQMAGTSNRAPVLKLVAPGVSITSAVPGSTFAVISGTSMAAPHVAAAWALLKSRVPDASVDLVLRALSETATRIIDASSGLNLPRINIERSAGSLGSDGSPTSVVVTLNGTRVTATWNGPFDGSSPAGYQVEILLASTGATVAVVNMGTAQTFSSTLPDGSYLLRVRAIAASGSTSVSSSIPFTVGQPANTQVPLAPQDLRSVVVGQTVSLSWNTAIGGAVATSFVLDVGGAPGLSNLGSFDTASAALTLVAGAVSPGTYYVRVRARNAFGTSAPSNEITVIVSGGGGCTTPLAPSGLHATVVGSLVTLAWTQALAGGTATGHIIEAGSGAGLSNILQLATGPATIFAGNASSGTYYVRVRATSPCGQSAPSNEVVVFVP